MKILFLHFSDIHVKDAAVAEDSVADKIINGITNLKFDEVVILFSGDIAQSGNNLQYESAKHFLGKVIKRIKQNFIEQSKRVHVLVAPGNHDINFNGKSRKREEVNSIKTNNLYNTKLNEEFANMKEFFEFANFQGCFKSDKLVDIVLLPFGNSNIQINIVNSAPFSCYYNNEDKKKNGVDDEKGLHYLAGTDIEKLKAQDKSDFCITIMHHSPEWFLPDISRKMQSIIYGSSNIVLMGHDHFYQSEYAFFEEQHQVSLLKGGTLFSNVETDAFNAFIFDTSTFNLKIYSVQWDKNNNFFNCQEKQDRLLDKAYTYKGFKPNKSFVSEMQATDLKNESIHKTFIFPNLIKIRQNELDEPAKVEEFSQFEKQINGKQLCVIEGAELSGKSQILKYCYFQEFKNRVPLYINIDDYPKIKNVKDLLWDAFQKQYCRDYSQFQKFMQLVSSEKVAFIDNIDKLPDRENFTNELSQYFSQIIVSSSIQQRFDISKAISEKEEVDFQIKYRIEPFYLGKRKELIRKICAIFYENKTEDEIYKKVEEINSFIQEQIKVFPLYPFFIINYCNHYLTKIGTENNKLNAFSIVFESSFRETLLKQDKIDVGVALAAIEYIAYEIAVNATLYNKIYPLTIEQFNKLLSDYCIAAKKKYINPVTFVDTLVNAKILKYFDEDKKIKFCLESTLAYFIAKKLLSLAFEESGQKLISHLVENSCFGMNAEILMFLCSLTNSETLFKYILNQTKIYLEGLDEWGFDKKNIQLFEFKVNERFVGAATKEVINSEEKRIEKSEKRIVEKSYDVIDLFDYTARDLEKFLNKEIRLIKNLCIISTIFANFEQRIFGTLKDAFIEELFVQPNKILYFLFKPFENQIEQSIEEVLQLRTIKNQTITKEQILNEFVELASLLILNLFNTVGRIATTKETIGYFDEYQKKNDNTNYLLEFIIMSENISKIEVFGPVAEALYKQTDRQIIKNMIKRIFKKHFIWNRVANVGYAQGIKALYLGDGKPTQMNIFLSQKKKK